MLIDLKQEGKQTVRPVEAWHEAAWCEQYGSLARAYIKAAC